TTASGATEGIHAASCGHRERPLVQQAHYSPSLHSDHAPSTGAAGDSGRSPSARVESFVGSRGGMRRSGAEIDISCGYSRCRGAQTGFIGTVVPTSAGRERTLPKGNTLTGTTRRYLIDIAYLPLPVTTPRRRF